ncbi:prolyl oligopeptidase family serine peptidase [Asticcacaulis benevestitus]|uniref:prolyl oligopeptidase n=1 Tax=Asticcacaulis benevestitus DSM 16100 = ATCC BAA-896 TaxID=1121022 RepID=V4NZ13_9CAUL|nr:prolyl oligopeptidase family serine peptidase [Asticcacaulis benevestitus]ESQ87012.1 hypothetical protein ABENE_17435 [Asticcacaulis benevestitus DSM 16100 = ATCC BAA-896]
MTNRRSFLVSALALTTSPALAKTRTKKPPVARTAPVSDFYYGQQVVDRYRWMETRDTPEWTKWLKGQADYARHVLDGLPNHRAITKTIAKYSQATTDAFLAQVLPDFLVVIVRSPGDATYKVFTQDRQTGARRLLIDPTQYTKNGQTANLGWSEVSPDGKWLAYGLDQGGNEVAQAFVREIATGKDILVTPISSRLGGWLPDSSAFTYYRLRADAIFGAADYNSGGTAWKHVIGSDPKTDEMIFGNKEGPGAANLPDDQPQVRWYRGSDHVLGLHIVNGALPYLIYTAKAADVKAAQTPWQPVFVTEDIVQEVTMVDGYIYALAVGAASNGEVIRVPASDPKSRTVVVPETVYVTNMMTVAKDGLYFHELRGPLGGLKKYSFASGQVENITLPAEGAVWGLLGNPTEDGVWFAMDSLTWPSRQFHYDGKTVTEVPLAPKLPYDVDLFETTRLDMPTRDGTMIPVEIMRRKDLKRDGMAPALIYAYGAYGSIVDPGFQGRLLAFLDLGGVYVYAHVRGGGEKGEAWHKAGMKATKPNTWRDAIDVAEGLVRDKWSGHGRLALMGTSAGGVMVGRAITERPDLFSAAIGDVGLFNALRFEITANGPGNDEEFGTVKKPEEFKALLEMDAYHHVKDGIKYPACLFITNANDPRVEPWVIGKMAARMQSATASGKPVILRVDYTSGHHAASAAAANAVNADIFSFVLTYASGMH